MTIRNGNAFSADFVGIVYINEDSNTYVRTLDSNNRPKTTTPTFHPAVLSGRLQAMGHTAKRSS